MIRRGTKRSELADDRETLHASAIRALRAAKEAIATLEREVMEVQEDRDYWRKRALKSEGSTDVID